jgi:serine/threonine protein kinase
LATLKNADWSNPQRFAVKLCRSGDPEIVNTSIETFKNQMILDHPYIVRALELYIDENTETHYLVMEHCPYPSIEDLVISRGIRLEERTVKAILSSCLKAI